MTKDFNYKALIIARESRGITQTKLAEDTDIPQSTISKVERGMQPIDDADLKKISEVLNYPVDFFYRAMDIYPPNMHYRKKATVSAKVLAKVEALMNIYKANIEELLKSVEFTGYHLPSSEDVKNLTPQDVARFIRQYWEIPKGAIANLTALIESKGVIVVEFDFETDKIDGRSIMTNLGVPIIFINKNMSADRKRFTLAHELAHIIMHVFATVTFETDIEDEAFVFAAELLMPENEIYSSLRGQLNIAKLADLKRYWKVSMAAILYWAQKMKAITQNHARYLWTQFSALRIRHVEPVVIPNETPSFLFSMMNFFKENLHYTVEDLSTIFCLKVDELQQNYLPIEQKMRLVR